VNGAMQVETTALDGVLILTPRRFGDDRGWFSEVWNARAMAEAGVPADFVQDNHSMSRAKGTLRGLHFQAPPHAQAKLVRCGAGAIWDVAVDARRGSPTYGQWLGVELSAANGRQLFVPEGFLHGFSTLTEGAEVLYKCTDYYAPSADGSVAWDSASLGIDWRLDGAPELSAKDQSAPDFAGWESPFVWEAAP
jgi:dTDP-4-dehydrorhamnose 3,5-epimerase